MDPYAGCQVDRFLLCQPPLPYTEGFDNSKTSAYGSLGIIFVRLGIAKIYEHTITQILGDMAIKALDDLSTGGVIGLNYFAQVFRVKLARERCRVHEVTEHDGELAAFGFRRSRATWCGLALRRSNVRRGRQRHGRSGGQCAGGPPGP